MVSQRLVGEKHLALKLEHRGKPVDGIWFGHTEPLPPSGARLAARCRRMAGRAAGALPGRGQRKSRARPRLFPVRLTLAVPFAAVARVGPRHQTSSPTNPCEGTEMNALPESLLAAAALSLLAAAGAHAETYDGGAHALTAPASGPKGGPGRRRRRRAGNAYGDAASAGAQPLTSTASRSAVNAEATRQVARPAGQPRPPRGLPATRRRAPTASRRSLSRAKPRSEAHQREKTWLSPIDVAPDTVRRGCARRSCRH